MNSFDTAMNQIADRVKGIMQFMQFKITDKGYPSVKRVNPENWNYSSAQGLYVSKDHTIYYVCDENAPPSDFELENLLAHEMVHAYQELDESFVYNQDLNSDEYWEQIHEREAMSVQEIYISMYLKGDESQQRTLAIINDYINVDRLTDLVNTIINVMQTNFKIQHNLI